VSEPARAARIRTRLFRAAAGLLATLLVALLALPVLGLVLATRPGELLAGLRHPVAGPALWLSLTTTAAALAIVLVLGTPLGWWLAGRRDRLGRAVETMVALPVVIPPAVAGIALLLTFGRRGLVGAWLADWGWSISFSTTAVVLAQVFVSAPFYVQAAVSAFRGLDPSLLVVARTLGASPARVFFAVALPLAAPGLIGGGAMAWARALGEFGATLMFAGNLEGKTQTLPLAIYTALESDMRAAQALALLLVVVAFGLLLVVRGQLLAGANVGTTERRP
jgi:molybdate transport system permease protein